MIILIWDLSQCVGRFAQQEGLVREGDLLTGGFSFTPPCGIPTVPCKERPELKDSNKRQTAALATI